MLYYLVDHYLYKVIQDDNLDDLYYLRDNKYIFENIMEKVDEEIK